MSYRKSLTVLVFTVAVMVGLETASAGPTVSGPSLNAEVEQALESGDCNTLMRLNRRYWKALESATVTERAQALHNAQALENAILAQPLCGRAEGKLLLVDGKRGMNFFDYRSVERLVQQENQ